MEILRGEKDYMHIISLKRRNNMRKLLADYVLKKAYKDRRIFVLTGGVGYSVWDNYREQLPNQFLNCEASEQAMLDIGVGLALEGKIPIVYSITPFLLYRPFESLRL